MKTTEKSTRKDFVKGSGVYPMSGPHPAGNVPIRGQMEWGQGDRGAAGYYDHGGSELSMDSGVLVGGFDQTWSGVPQPGMPVPAVTEVPVAEWPIFCDWFTKNFHGILISLERQNQCDSRVEIRSQPFEELSARVLENSVSALSVVADAEPRRLCIDVTGPLGMKLYRNPSGWPLLLEIEQASGKTILHFAGEVEASSGFSSNACGE